MTTDRLVLDERRVYRTIAFPVSAFDALQRLKRAWRMQTNGEVITRVLLEFTDNPLLKNDDAGGTDCGELSDVGSRGAGEDPQGDPEQP